MPADYTRSDRVVTRRRRPWKLARRFEQSEDRNGSDDRATDREDCRKESAHVRLA
jgi:hypothetical protein